MIEAPGIYNITDEEYHADPCPEPSGSCSILQLIDTKSPMHALWQHPKLHPQFSKKEHSNRMNFGSAFHAMMTNKQEKVVPVSVMNWKTKEARLARDEIIRKGKIPLTMNEPTLVNNMKNEAASQLEKHDGRFVWNADYEHTLIWKEGDFWFRCKPDVLWTPTDMMWDFKATETSAAPDSFHSHMYRENMDFRAAYYARGYNAVMGRPLKEYRFIPVEVDPPHCLSVFSLTPEAMDFAAKKVERAIDIWKRCLSNNEWPRYGTKVCYVGPTKWAENKQIEREISESEEE